MLMLQQKLYILTNEAGTPLGADFFGGVGVGGRGEANLERDDRIFIIEPTLPISLYV